MTTAPRAKDIGRLRRHARFASRYLSTPRDLVVYLPPCYEGSEERYPVFYLQDGQNLFDPATAFNCQDWGADVTADQLIEAGSVQPLIMVGIYNTGVRRVSEYTPTRDPGSRKGGKAERYAQMLAREIKPFIDREYRTLKPTCNAALGGSSLGGIVSLTSGLQYPKVFGKMAVMSPSVWWDRRVILARVESYSEAVRPKIWLDAGTAEGQSPEQVVEDTRRLRDALVAKGWREGTDLNYSEVNGASHNEQAWASRFGCVLEYLFPR